MAIGVKRIDLATSPEWERGMVGLAAERHPWADMSDDEIATLQRLETWSDAIHPPGTMEVAEGLSPRWIWLLLAQVSWQSELWEDPPSALRWIEKSAPRALSPFWKAFAAWQRAL